MKAPIDFPPSRRRSVAIALVTLGYVITAARITFGEDGEKIVVFPRKWGEASGQARDLATVQRWWTTEATLYPALLTGESSLVLVDQDTSAAQEWWDTAGEAGYRLQSLRGGRHDYFRADPDAPVASGTKHAVLGGLIDTRGVGGIAFVTGALPPRIELSLAPAILPRWTGESTPEAAPSRPDTDDPFTTAYDRGFTVATASAYVEEYGLAPLRAAQVGTIQTMANTCSVVLSHFEAFWSAQERYAMLCDALRHTAYDGKTWRATRFRRIIDGSEPVRDPWRAVLEESDPVILAAIESNAAGKPKKSPKERDSAGFFSDAILAEAFARDVLTGRWVWTRSIGWFGWDGKVWSEVSEVAATEAARTWVARRFRAAAKKATASKDDVERLMQWRKCLARGRIESVLALARGIVEVDLERFDADPMLLNTPAGVLDLLTGQLGAHNPSHAMTRITRTSPGSEGAEEFRKFLERVLPEEETRAYVQRILGHSLLGEVREHVLPTWNGIGANGKGTLRNAVLYALGEYALEADPGLIMKRGHDRHLTFLMELRKRRLVFTSETQGGQDMDESVMKRLTGGDPIQANRMRRDPVTFSPSHTLVLLTNHLPRIHGDDAAVARRMCVIPFDEEIPESEQDKSLDAKLRRAAPAVLTWMLDGLAAYLVDGLAAPLVVTERTAGYLADSDPLGRFLTERVESVRGGRTGARALWQEYERWMRDAGEEPGTETAFARDMTRRRYARKTTSAGAVYDGVRVRALGHCPCPNGAYGEHRVDCTE